MCMVLSKWYIYLKKCRLAFDSEGISLVLLALITILSTWRYKQSGLFL